VWQVTTAGKCSWEVGSCTGAAAASNDHVAGLSDTSVAFGNCSDPSGTSACETGYWLPSGKKINAKCCWGVGVARLLNVHMNDSEPPQQWMARRVGR
jgi:hypothetical protein